MASLIKVATLLVGILVGGFLLTIVLGLTGGLLVVGVLALTLLLRRDWVPVDLQRALARRAPLDDGG